MFFLNELSLIITNLWPLHGTFKGYLELKLTTSVYGLKGQSAHSPGQRPEDVRSQQSRPARAQAHPQVNAIAKGIMSLTAKLRLF